MTNSPGDSDYRKQPRPNIDDGLPASRNEWPISVLGKLERFAQGDVVKNPPFFYAAEPAAPVWRMTHDYMGDSDDSEIIESDPDQRPEYGIITSQTCDVAEEGKERPVYPWVQISPVYDRSDLDSGLRKLLRQGSGPKHLIYLPALPDGFWVADFRIELPVEKGWLACQEAVDGFANEDEKRIIGKRLAWMRSRPALAGRLVEAVQKPLVDELKRLKRCDTNIFARMHEQVDEVALRADSLLEPADVQLVLILNSVLDSDLLSWWLSWWDSAVDLANQKNINLLPLEHHLADEISLAEYRRMSAFPLARVSPD